MISRLETRQLVRNLAPIVLFGFGVALGVGMLAVVAMRLGAFGGLVIAGGVIALAAAVAVTLQTIKAWGLAIDDGRTIAHLMAEASTDGVWLYNPGTKATFFSKRLRQQIHIGEGFDIPSIIGLIDKENRDRAESLWQNLLENHTPFSIEAQIDSPSGSKWYRWNGRSSYKQDSAKQPVFYGSISCTHEMREIEAGINDVALLAIENPSPVFRVDLEGVIVLANKSTGPLLDSWGIDAGGKIPGGLMQLLSPVFDSGMQFEMEFACGDQLYGALFVPHIPKGYVNIYCTDVTERAKANKAVDESRRELHKLMEKMKFMAQHDVLTQLPNRALFEDRMTMALEHGKRHDSMMALMMIDLDRFKEINDTYGHDAGDTVLVTVSKRLSGAVRASDTVARLGGDEFAIVLSDLKEEGNAIAIANKILGALTPVIPHKNVDLRTSPSIGITFYSGRKAVSIEELYKRADIAMYHAKKAGRNTYRVYDNGMAAEPELTPEVAEQEPGAETAPLFDVDCASAIHAIFFAEESAFFEVVRVETAAEP